MYLRATFLTLWMLFCVVVASSQSPSGTLPILTIVTDSAIDSKETYVGGGCYLSDGEQGWGSADSLTHIRIRGRGNYTWRAFDKKPYHLRFDEPLPLMGMPANEHFLLLAHADDWLGYLRNTVGFELSRRLDMPYTPRQEAVELIINGDYLGLYFVTEQIRVGDDRVEVVEQLGNDSAHDPAEGGWLLEIDNYGDENQVTLRVDSVHRTLFTIHSPRDMSSRQRQWITDRLTLVDSLVRYSDPADDAWAEYIDIEVLARFYVIQEMLDNIEAFHGSCYMTIGGGDDGRLQFGPVWDFGNAFARGYAPEQHFITEGDNSFNKTWIESLVRHPQFMGRVRQIWTTFYESGLTDLDGFIDTFTAHISGAIDANCARWPDYNTDNMLPRWATFKRFLAKRVEFLNGHWSMSGVSDMASDEPRITIGDGLLTVDVTTGERIALQAYSPDGRVIPLAQIANTVWQTRYRGIALLRVLTPSHNYTTKALLR